MNSIQIARAPCHTLVCYLTRHGAKRTYVSIRCRFRLNVSSFTFTPSYHIGCCAIYFSSVNCLQLINIALRERTQWTSWTFCEFSIDIFRQIQMNSLIKCFQHSECLLLRICDISKFNLKAIRLIKGRNNTGEFTRCYIWTQSMLHGGMAILPNGIWFDSTQSNGRLRNWISNHMRNFGNRYKQSHTCDGIVFIF